MNVKQYESPALDVIRFSSEDVLIASGKVLPNPGQNETPIVIF